MKRVSTPAFGRQWPRWLPLLVIIAGIGAYYNSFTGAFVFDDRPHILENWRVHRLWPLWDVLGGTSRPLVSLSLAINYALSGTRVWSYHAVNLLIHLLAALALFGVIRRTLLTTRLRPRYGHSAHWLALAVSLLWVVHPLHTQSVTYTIQRGESLMGLCYLLTLYSVIRSAETSQRRWMTCAILACAMGMATKPVMVTAPLVAWIYDGIFLSGSLASAWRQRKRLYLGLAATWGVLIWCLVAAPADYQTSAGFAFTRISPLEYALTQPGVILHYLRLVLWPHPLVFDYGWPVATTTQEILPPLLVIGALIFATLWALRHRPPLGFLGAAFFLILAPSSSLIPIADLAFEHRMYLPLAAVISFGVVVGDWIASRLVGAHRLRQTLAVGLLASLTLLLGLATIRRNEDYRDGVTMWRDTLSKRPNNPRAHNNLCDALIRQGQPDAAIPHCHEALRLRPDYPDAYHNLGDIAVTQSKLQEAVAHYTRALRLKPEDEKSAVNLAVVLALQGHIEAAQERLSHVLQRHPGCAEAHYNLGLILARQKQFGAAEARFVEALRLDPALTAARESLGKVRARQAR